MVDGPALLDVGHLPDAGHGVQHAGHLGARLVPRAGTVYKPLQYPQIMVLKIQELNHTKEKND